MHGLNIFSSLELKISIKTIRYHKTIIITKIYKLPSCVMARNTASETLNTFL